MSFEPPVIVESQQPATAAVIWLHGLGADGYDFEPIVPQLQFTQRDQARFIFPHAKVRPVTLNAGMPCRAWFDILSLREPGNEDIAGMNATNDYVQSLINEQIADGIDSKKIVLAGFSQGGAMAMYSALLCDKPLAGVMGLSTLLGGSLELEKSRAATNQHTPMLLTHGHHDEVLPYALGEKSCEILRSWGYPVEWKSYPMGHHLCPDEITDIAQFLQDNL